VDTSSFRELLALSIDPSARMHRADGTDSIPLSTLVNLYATLFPVHFLE
jgi:hypothetical protein